MTAAPVDAADYLRFVASLVLVLGLVLAGVWALRKFGVGGMVSRAAGRRRLAVVEAVAVDGRRRLVLVRRDDREHLLLVGGVTDVVVECGIRPQAPDPVEEGRP